MGNRPNIGLLPWNQSWTGSTALPARPPFAYLRLGHAPPERRPAEQRPTCPLRPPTRSAGRPSAAVTAIRFLPKPLSTFPFLAVLPPASTGKANSSIQTPSRAISRPSAVPPPRRPSPLKHAPPPPKPRPRPPRLRLWMPSFPRTSRPRTTRTTGSFFASPRKKLLSERSPGGHPRKESSPDNLFKAATRTPDYLARTSCGRRKGKPIPINHFVNSSNIF